MAFAKLKNVLKKVAARTRNNLWDAISQTIDTFLEESNAAGVFTRPIWRLMTDLSMFSRCQNDGLPNPRCLVNRVESLPSSVPESEFERLKG